MPRGVPSSKALSDNTEVEGLEPPATEDVTPSEEQPTDEKKLSKSEETEFGELINVGRLIEERTVLGRRILFQTLTVDEELQVALLTKPYIQTDGYGRAFRTAVVAASVRAIDGESVYNPLNKVESKTWVSKRFEIFKDYYPLAVDQIFGEFRKIEDKLLKLVDKLGKSEG